jgi:hypothetical protein
MELETTRCPTHNPCPLISTASLPQVLQNVNSATDAANEVLPIQS